jgi:hypothetical protein
MYLEIKVLLVSREAKVRRSGEALCPVTEREYLPAVREILPELPVLLDHAQKRLSKTIDKRPQRQ